MPEEQSPAEKRIGVVTLLFTDLDPSSDPLPALEDETRAPTDAHLCLLRDAVATSGVEEVKNLGDGFMVVFASVPDALACAVRMQQAGDRHNRLEPEEHALCVRAGLHVGEPNCTEDDAPGTAVAIAKQLCRRASAGGIVVSDPIRLLAGSRGGYTFHELRETPIRDVAETFPIYEVRWQSGDEDSLAAIPLPPPLARGERAVFIGRRGEMAQLGSLWAAARAGQCQVIFLTGEAGIGKTCLASEFGLGAYADGATVLFGHTDEDMTLPYQPLAEALRHYVRSCPVDVLTAKSEIFSAGLSRLVPELSQRLPDLPVAAQADADTERYRLFDAVVTLLAEASRIHPIILILDDLQWADKQTFLLLKHIARLLEQAPVFVLGTFREAAHARAYPLSDAIADMRRYGACRRIPLEGLDAEDVEAMIGVRVGKDASPAFIRAVFEQTEGNPFFIEEMLRHLQETGAIYQRNGRWQTDLTIHQIGIPDGVKDVIDRRLSQLSEECNSVLTIASVIGREFDIKSLGRASDLSEDRLLDLLEEAVASRVLAEAPHADGRYSFSHALFHETLYDELTTTRRVRLHGQILQYADNNGIKLAYEVLGGSGPHLVALGLGTSAAIRPRNMRLARRWERFSRNSRLILYDRRGLGFSAAPEEGYDLMTTVEDLRAVLEAVGAGRVVLWGATDGGPLALTFAVQHPDRVAGLVLAGTTPKLINSEDFAWGINPDIMKSFLHTDSSDRARAVSHLTIRYNAEGTEGNIEVMRRIPKHAWSQILVTVGAADARPLLGTISAPTLIIHDPGNKYIPVEAAYHLHEHIAGSVLEVTEEYQTDPFGDNLYRKIEAFVEEVTTRTHKSWDISNYHLLRTREALLRDDLGEASSHAELALEFSADMESTGKLALIHLAKAYVMQASGRPGDADECLGHTFALIGESKNENVEFNAHWAKAEFALKQEDESAGLAALKKALTIGKRRGYLDIFIERPPVTARLCARALEAGIEIEYVRELIRTRNLIPDECLVHLENWPWILQIYTMGQFRIAIDGKPVEFSRKTQQKPLAMLKALVAFGGSGVNEEHIADALWPDAEGDMAHRSFATTLHRLRKLIGRHEVISLQRGRLTLDDRYCWVDARAFEHLIRKADALWEKEHPTDKDVAEAVQVTRNAIDIYWGPFLAGESEEFWVISARESLRSKFLRSVEKLGRYREKVGHWNEAVECYQRGLEMDDLLEGLYRRLMVCYAQIGRKSEALSVYDRCKKVLSTALGIDPSPETEAIRESLLSEENP